MSSSIRIALILLIGLSFVAVHELGHFIFADFSGLNPSFEYKIAEKSSLSGLFGLSIGVGYNPAAAADSFFVVLGATVLPLLVALVALAGYAATNRQEFALLFEVYIILILINLIPLPGTENLDANKLWGAVFS